MGIELKQEQANVEAFKQGVQSTAPEGGWGFSDEQRPADKNDVSYLGVKVHTTEGGMSVDTNHAQEMRVPVGDMSLKQIFAAMAGVPESAITRDIPGNTADYYREIGQHEGGHLHHREGTFDGGLGDERRGDKAAYNGDNPAVEEALRDTRKIYGLVNPTYATSPGLPQEPGGEAPEVNTLKLHAAAQNFHDTVVADLMSKGVLGSPDDLKKLQQENPQVVHDSVLTLRKGGAFDDIQGSVGQYTRQLADDYLETSKKWLDVGQSPSPSAPSGPTFRQQPPMNGP